MEGIGSAVDDWIEVHMSRVVGVECFDQQPFVVGQEVPVQVDIVLVDSAGMLEAEWIYCMHEHYSGQVVGAAATIGISTGVCQVLKSCVLDCTSCL